MGGQVSRLALDAATLGVVLAAALGSFGYWRGVRAEGITLAGVIGFTMVFTAEQVQSRFGDITAGLSRGLISNGSDWQTAPLLLLFFVAAIGMYVAGGALGGKPSSSTQKLTGSLMGALSGLVISGALAELSKGVLGRHPEWGRLRIDLPTLPAQDLMAANSIPPFAPWAVAGALSLVVVMALASRARTRR